MPSRNTVKQYVENGYYHLYNRGVDKRTIFQDDQDYRVFLHLLKILLSSPSLEAKHPLTEVTGFNPVRLRLIQQTLHNKVELLSYCLLPNHFHLLIKQITVDGMPILMKRLITTYSMYFNNRYKRVGHLFQGTYKAAYIGEDSYIMHVSRYIHLNPYELTGSNLVKVSEYPYSSYSYYLGKKKAKWVKPDFILSYFKNHKYIGLQNFISYKSFVEDSKVDSFEIIGELSIE